MTDKDLNKCFGVVAIAATSIILALITLFPRTQSFWQVCTIGATIGLLLMAWPMSAMSIGDHKARLNFSLPKVRFLLYFWSLICLFLLSLLFCWTGGVRNSPLVWVYEIVIITALCINSFTKIPSLGADRSAALEHLNQNRLVYSSIVMSICFLVIVGTDGTASIKLTPVYYLVMACYTLLISMLLFFQSRDYWRKETASGEEQL